MAGTRHMRMRRLFIAYDWPRTLLELRKYFFAVCAHRANIASSFGGRRRCLANPSSCCHFFMCKT
jgi:hypothetical protein